MPCYEPPAYTPEQVESAVTAARLLCRLVMRQVNTGQATPAVYLAWFIAHRKIDYKMHCEKMKRIDNIFVERDMAREIPLLIKEGQAILDDISIANKLLAEAVG